MLVLWKPCVQYHSIDSVPAITMSPSSPIKVPLASCGLEPRNDVFYVFFCGVQDPGALIAASTVTCDLSSLLSTTLTPSMRTGSTRSLLSGVSIRTRVSQMVQNPCPTALGIPLYLTRLLSGSPTSFDQLNVNIPLLVSRGLSFNERFKSQMCSK
jgi:hypothetical protein